MTGGSAHRATRWQRVAAGLLVCGCAKKPLSTTAPPTIAAAADLTGAFTEVGTAFEHQFHVKPVFAFASSGSLEKQIQDGAPFDLFAAANVEYIDQAAWSGACEASSKKVYAQGRLALWTKNPAAPPSAFNDLRASRFGRIAIADPAHAPYGKGAVQALKRAELWETVKPRLVLGENVQRALELAETGGADVAVVALSLALGAPGGNYVLVDPNLHAPINQALVVCKHGPNPGGGKTFADFMNGDQGRAILKKHGFVLPGEREAPP